MSNEERDKNRDRIQAMRNFIIDFNEDPTQFGSLTPDVLWNLMEWRVEPENQDKGVIVQEPDCYEFDSDDDYWEHVEAVAFLNMDLEEATEEAQWVYKGCPVYEPIIIEASEPSRVEGPLYLPGASFGIPLDYSRFKGGNRER